MTLIAATGLRKTYRLGRVDVPVLKGVDFAVERGEWVCVLGASGSGKSTLLHLLGGLDRPDRRDGGHIAYEGRALESLSAHELDRYRTERVGFVFQFYHLLPEFTVLENTLAPAMIRYGRIGYSRQAGALREKAAELLDAFGLADRLCHRPAELSGGERQRVAIARALINDPDLLLADEPTGNLDAETGAQILETVARVRVERGQTIVMVTHDAVTARRADRRLRLESGVMAPVSRESAVATVE
jgi:lipoprotein-releasing system ATP-binding protein